MSAIDINVVVPLVPGTKLSTLAALVNAFERNIPGCVLGAVIGDAVEVVLPASTTRRRWLHYDDETKAAAVERALEHGPSAVAAELGVHRATVRRWVQEAPGHG